MPQHLQGWAERRVGCLSSSVALEAAVAGTSGPSVEAVKLGAFGPSSRWTPGDESERARLVVTNERGLLATAGMEKRCRWA